MKSAVRRELATRAIALAFFVAPLFFMLSNLAGPHPEYHIGFSPHWLQMMYLPIVLTAAVSAPLVFAQFSFGYLVGFYLFAMIAAFFWLNTFSLLEYDHNAALGSAALSLFLFLLPALAIRGNLKYRLQLPQGVYERLPEAILFFGASVVAVSAWYGFHVVGLELIYQYQAALAHPRLLDYAIGNLIGALIPFAFAICVERKRWILLSALCALSLLLYPVTLTKTGLFAAPFLLFMAALSSKCEPRICVVLSLLIPLAVGIWAMFFVNLGVVPFLISDIVNIRLLAIPATSLEHYYAFFSEHPPTHFCQISFLKEAMSCPYSTQLGVVMANAYHIGNMNASLFATEGVASVGMIWAPLSAFACGLIIAIGNIASRALSARFVLVSGAIAAHTLLDVPLSTTLLTNGLGLLIALWFVKPRGSGVSTRQHHSARRRPWIIFDRLALASSPTIPLRPEGPEIFQSGSGCTTSRCGL